MSLKSSILVLILLSAVVSSVAQGELVYPSTKELKAAAIAKFIEEANKPHSRTAMAIADYNSETEDGRNPLGTIDPKITKASLQVATVSAEQMHTPWRYAEKVNGFCKAVGDSATFVILVSARQLVRGAEEFTVLGFKVTATKKMSSKIMKDGDGVYCQEVGNDPNFGPVKTSIEVSDIEKVQLPEIAL